MLLDSNVNIVMSQKIAYDLLVELGGEATLPQIKTMIRNKYPDYTLDKYVSSRLRSLVAKGCIRYNHRLRTYKIVDTFD